MKDYSLNEKDRRNFILDYKITKDGRIIVRLAKGEPLILPYNERNEQILLEKMEEQVMKASSEEQKIVDKKNKHKKSFYRMFGGVLVSTLVILTSDIGLVDTIFGLLFSISTIYGVASIIEATYLSNILEDLKRNRRFLEIKDKVNTNIRSNQNVLVNVSNYTRNDIKKASPKKPMFSINSFDKYPFDDFEIIVENIERNANFGFDYTEPKRSKGPVKKRVR